MNKEQLDAIRARCEAATPGAWVYIPEAGEVISQSVGDNGFPKTICRADENDGIFISHAYDDLPMLLAEVEWLNVTTAELADECYAEALRADEAEKHVYQQECRRLRAEVERLTKERDAAVNSLWEEWQGRGEQDVHKNLN